MHPLSILSTSGNALYLLMSSLEPEVELNCSLLHELLLFCKTKLAHCMSEAKLNFHQRSFQEARRLPLDWINCKASDGPRQAPPKK